MSDQEIEALIADVALRNDRPSFKRLYLFYYRKLFCLAKSLVKSTEEAEEIVNDTFLSIWLKRADLQQIRNFTIYICTAVRNKSLTAMSRMKVYEHLSLEDIDIDLKDTGYDGEENLYYADLNRILSSSVDKLPNQCKLVFKLVKEDGFKYKEVAELLNISVKTVEYHMGNALKKIAERLADAAKPAKNII
ncbi:RNA polymerase sigma-70 factor (ECF subfamily) [Mucilaginibacter yixingensis]|uniref:RNA polymerase sigma-70 factor (ECF subfamily) n=1 Tax=Mucilaginibacter yixingensis TaxID=1295612 RepID=A0A2T5JCQ5_9SPHI|nr:RNA polymerase sigma-70 factor [Mucilaginibacter yixingensis]PTQ99540.1 RNA polymerase sigma-70 factor (ECF subfamily) [Mucilaginibacter yixingensis]